ncbi:MAG: hypothetical protein MUO34_14995 [Ignavibacteriaceae bacterium]|nr:hypothetical protein [Ignavibacteriaceae bacterium]
MKNAVICKNCSAENSIYTHICTSCKYFIRDKVSNIDIGETIESIAESPSTAFKKIIFSEHKNFIVFLTILFALRILILSRFVSLILSESAISTTPLIMSYLSVLSSVIVLFVLISTLISFILNKKDYKVRFRDIYSLNIYSTVPNLFAVIILFPIELIVFGAYLFSNNPNPFQVKTTIAYILFSFELGMILWSVFLNYKANYALTASKSVSLMITALNYFLIIALIIVLAVTVFFI